MTNDLNEVALVAVVSVSLVGVVMAVLIRAWGAFEARFLRLSPLRGRVVHSILISLVPILLLVVYTTAVGLQHSRLMWATSFYVAIPILLVPVLLVVVLGWRKRDWLTFVRLFASLLLVVSVVLSLVALLGIITVVVDIEHSDDFGWSRWLLYDAVFFFVSGVLLLGLAQGLSTVVSWKEKGG